MISSGKMHPDSTELLSRDDFRRRNSSWFEEISVQGWFPPEKFILIRRNCSVEMIPSRETAHWFSSRLLLDLAMKTSYTADKRFGRLLASPPPFSLPFVLTYPVRTLLLPWLLPDPCSHQAVPESFWSGFPRLLPSGFLPGSCRPYGLLSSLARY